VGAGRGVAIIQLPGPLVRHDAPIHVGVSQTVDDLEAKSGVLAGVELASRLLAQV